MILGVVSDTHNQFQHVDTIVEIFNNHKVDLVVHTGDITQAKTLNRFSKLTCKLIAVYGNNDRLEEGLKEESILHGFVLEEPPLIKEIFGKKVAIFHEPEDIYEFILNNEVDLILHGHTHKYTNEIIKDTLIFNPGECAGILKGKNSIGIIEFPELLTKRIFF